MKSRLFWKLFITSAALILASVGGISWTIHESWDPRSTAIAVAVVVVALLATTAWLVARIVRPVGRLTRAAEQITAGNYRHPVYIGTQDDELGQLARAFNAMRQEMNARESQLRDANRQLSTVLGGMTDGVIAINDQQEILFANRAAGQLMGFSPEEVRGKTLLASVRNHSLHALVVSLLANPGQRQLELEWGDGRRSLLVNATSLPSGPSSGIVMVIHNLSEIRRLEAMRRDFVANVSHELKTPLSSIKAYAETLLDGAINDPAHREPFVRQIEDQANRLHELITDLLSLARIEAERQQLDVAPADVERIVRLCVPQHQRAAEAKQLGLVVEPGDQRRVLADERGLRQILDNLIDNAIKYTHAGGTVTVGWRSEDEVVAIYVRDTGIGIPPAVQARVFERFFRVDQARSRDLGGTGLGLAIVKHLAQNMRGAVQVESQPDQGSCFTVRLPAEEPSASDAGQLAAQASETAE